MADRERTATVNSRTLHFTSLQQHSLFPFQSKVLFITTLTQFPLCVTSTLASVSSLHSIPISTRFFYIPAFIPLLFPTAVKLFSLLSKTSLYLSAFFINTFFTSL